MTSCCRWFVYITFDTLCFWSLLFTDSLTLYHQNTWLIIGQVDLGAIISWLIRLMMVTGNFLWGSDCQLRWQDDMHNAILIVVPSSNYTNTCWANNTMVSLCQYGLTNTSWANHTMVSLCQYGLTNTSWANHTIVSLCQYGLTKMANHRQPTQAGPTIQWCYHVSMVWP